MENVAFVFARDGSKGVPDKNIKILGGKPLIGLSIECAFKVSRIKRVIVSTDSNKIADIARQFGAEVPFIRPEHLSRDSTPEWQAWKHALNYLKDSEGNLPEIMISVPTTSPLRSYEDINSCLDKYEEGDADAVVTITKSQRNPYFNMVKKAGDETFTLVNEANKTPENRQGSPEVFDMTTVCYVANSNFVLSNDGIFQGRVKAVEVPQERALDIDTEFDFKVAEALIKSGKITL